MADVLFNVAKGRHAYYAMLPETDDSLILVPIETAGIVNDATMIDYDTLALLLAGASNEQTTMGRKTLANVTSTVNDTTDKVIIDCDDVVYTAPSGNAISAFVVCYKPTAASADSACIPLYKYDFVYTPDSVDLTVVVNSGGLADAS